MRYFIDGDWIVITLDDFVDLQQSPAQLISVNSEAGRAIIAGGVGQLPFGLFRSILERLKHERAQGTQAVIMSMIETANNDRGTMPSIAGQKFDLRREIVDHMEAVIRNSSWEKRLSITLGLTRSLARKMTLSELINWRDRVIIGKIEDEPV